MKKAWKVVCVVILIIILLGAISVGIGLFSGADSTRIYEVLNEQFNFSDTYNYYASQINSFLNY